MSHTSPASPTEGQPAQPAELQFIIYSRSYCHLCDDLRGALRAALGAQPAQIEMIDVDADPALVARYDELVPVLMGQARDGQWLQLCHYHLDPLRLQDFLAAR
ncbi:glutaredoxin family protein [Herbaspirillum frisingense]|uniref:glutaredoxin family protein n=1 Tax=Herbaspirillum frisingense TaxID=92645 RepID=UPI001601E438|nr:glutaredoxin family protein [Herbaspirillum frisingense]QNB07190.1 glutaredoxin family protein [Herbaspirillum frisingense]